MYPSTDLTKTKSQSTFFNGSFCHKITISTHAFRVSVWNHERRSPLVKSVTLAIRVTDAFVWSVGSENANTSRESPLEWQGLKQSLKFFVEPAWVYKRTFAINAIVAVVALPAWGPGREERLVGVRAEDKRFACDISRDDWVSLQIFFRILTVSGIGGVDVLTDTIHISRFLQKRFSHLLMPIDCSYIYESLQLCLTKVHYHYLRDCTTVFISKGINVLYSTASDLAWKAWCSRTQHVFRIEAGSKHLTAIISIKSNLRGFRFQPLGFIYFPSDHGSDRRSFRYMPSNWYSK